MKILYQNPYLSALQSKKKNDSNKTVMTNPFRSAAQADSVAFTSKAAVVENAVKKEAAFVERMGLEDLPKRFRKGKNRVLVRVDHNVPINDDGSMGSKDRITETIPTFIELLKRKASITVMAHIGDPNKVSSGKKGVKTSTEIVAKELQAQLNKVPGFEKIEVIHIKHSTGKKVREAQQNLKQNQILYLENVRFKPVETGKRARFVPEKNEYVQEKVSQKVIDAHSDQIAKNGDYSVLEGFGVSHRKHNSVLNKKFKGKKVMGYRMAKEVKAHVEFMNAPASSVAAFISGAKVADKTNIAGSLVNKQLKKGDTLGIFGAMTYTFREGLARLEGRKISIGSSLREKDPVKFEEQVEFAKNLLQTAKEKGIKVILAEDSVVGNKANPSLPYKTVHSDEIEPGYAGFDIGRKTQDAISDAMKRADKIILNGPAGLIEDPKYRAGSFSMLNDLNQATRDGKKTLSGGGNTGDVMEMMQFPKEGVWFHSTGGGAMLDFIAEGTVPGLEALTPKRIPKSNKAVTAK